jgi:Caspase domain
MNCTKEPAMFTKSQSILTNAKRLPFAVVLGLFFICADLAHAQDSLPDCFVVSIGVDNYTHIGKLKGDVNDARNTAAAFTAQQGKLFGKVSAYTLLDGEATRAKIASRVQAIDKLGKAGDYVVLFMSGHGGISKETNQWYFCPCDFDSKNFARTAVTDRQVLETADGFAGQGKKVLIVVDACFSGQLRTAAKPYFDKYRNPTGGGLVVMVSSTAEQTSNALGDYSAFAKAFADSMAGAADLNRDGKVTLEEIRHYSGKRTYELLKQHGNQSKQDSAVAWSPSISGNMTMAMPTASKTSSNTNTASVNTTTTRSAAVKTSSKRWIGTENLPGYGPLAMTFSTDGSVVMADAKATSTGTWEATGDQVTARFDNGRVLYTATLRGGMMSGSASNGNRTWSWSVQAEAVQPSTVAEAK